MGVGRGGVGVKPKKGTQKLALTTYKAWESPYKITSYGISTTTPRNLVLENLSDLMFTRRSHFYLEEEEKKVRKEIKARIEGEEGG